MASLVGLMGPRDGEEVREGGSRGKRRGVGGFIDMTGWEDGVCCSCEVDLDSSVSYVNERMVVVEMKVVSK